MTVSAHAFTRDGQQLVASRGDLLGTWDARTGELVGTPWAAGHVVTVSPTRRRVVVRTSDKSVRIAGIDARTLTTGMLQHEQPVLSAVFSSNEQYLATATADEVRIWDVRTGQSISLPMSLADGDGDSMRGTHVGPPSVQFSPDARSLCTASETIVQVWDVPTGRPRIARLGGNQAMRYPLPGLCAFSSDGERLAGLVDDMMSVWNARTGQKTVTIQARRLVVAAKFSPDGKRIATASSDGTVRIWDAIAGFPLTEEMAHRRQVNVLAWATGGERLLTASLDGAVRMWDAHTGKPLTEPWGAPEDHPWRSTEFSPDGERVYTASESNGTSIWDVPVASRGDSESIAALAEAVAGVRLNAAGAMVPTVGSTATLERLRRESSTAADGEHTFLGVARWFLADRWERPISPFATLTLSQLIRRCMAEKDQAALDELLHEFPGYPTFAAANWPKRSQ